MTVVGKIQGKNGLPAAICICLSYNGKVSSTLHNCDMLHVGGNKLFRGPIHTRQPQ